MPGRENESMNNKYPQLKSALNRASLGNNLDDIDYEGVKDWSFEFLKETFPWFSSVEVEEQFKGFFRDLEEKSKFSDTTTSIPVIDTPQCTLNEPDSDTLNKRSLPPNESSFMSLAPSCAEPRVQESFLSLQYIPGEIQTAEQRKKEGEISNRFKLAKMIDGMDRIVGEEVTLEELEHILLRFDYSFLNNNSMSIDEITLDSENKENHRVQLYKKLLVGSTLKEQDKKLADHKRFLRKFDDDYKDDKRMKIIGMLILFLRNETPETIDCLHRKFLRIN